MNQIICLCHYKNDTKDLNKEIERINKLLKKQYLHKHSLSNHLIMCYKKHQCMNYRIKNKDYSILYNGEIYNILDIKKELLMKNYIFQTNDEAEVILAAYDAYKEKCLEIFNGGFTFIIHDGQQLFIARDIMGIKPLYYTTKNNTLIISNEIKSILAYLNEAIVDQEGIKELLGLGPSCTPGKTIYKDINSLRPAHYMIYDGNINIYRYWHPVDLEHNDSLEETIHKVKSIVIDSIQKQMDHHCSTMLSGGLDSSIITSIASQFTNPITTYSLSYEEQKEHFKAYEYQTTMDDDYIKEMIDLYHTNHVNIELTQQELVDYLEESLIARDMPGMADIDSSFYLFSKEISQNHKICLSGECADEFMGGYPWFYKKELYNQPYFPWMRDLDEKIKLFHPSIRKLNIKDYIIEQYKKTLKEIKTKDFKKQMMYLNKEWFMQTLLMRCESQTINSSLTVRVPFASKELFEYVYNIPYDYMFLNNEEKGLLRKAFEDFLPEDIAHRKKNPFPKTHHPLYTKLIIEKLEEILKDESNILYQLFDKNALFDLIQTKGESFQYPWYGQLMTGPQLLAYFYQIALWGKIYKIKLIKE